MKFLALAIMVALTVVAHAVVVDDALMVDGLISGTKRRRLQRAVETAGGCFANICFAIDGSGSISDKAFQNEKFFILDLHSIVGVDERADMGAVQYATSTNPIIPLTDDRDAFVLAINGTKQVGGFSFVVGGMNYCIRALRRKSVKKIVLLGDGRSNIGSDTVARANLFRERLGGTVCAVGAGFPDDEELLAIVGGNPDLVFEVDSFEDTLDMADLIDDLVAGICNIPLRTLTRNGMLSG